MNAFAAKYKARYGFDVNFLGETGYTAAQFVLAVLIRRGAISRSTASSTLWRECATITTYSAPRR